MKQKISILLALLSVAAISANCKPEKKDDTTAITALLLYVNEQMSGNCATVTRNTKTSYSVTINTVPKGACKRNESRADAISSYETQKTNIVAFYKRAGAVCDTLTTGVANLINVQITNLNNTTEIVYTSDVVANTRVFVVGNLVTESSAKLKNDGRTDAQIAAMSPGSLDDLFFSSAITYAAGFPACATAVKALNQTTADALTSTPPTKLTSSSCTYGSSQPASTKCTTLNTEF